MIYDPLDKTCKSVTGAFPRGKTVTFNIYREEGGEEDFSADVCNLIMNRDGQELRYYQMTPSRSGWTISLRFHEVGLYFYYFKIGGRYLCRGEMRKGEFRSSNPVPWQITVYREDYRTPDWFKGGIMYQIFPDRFCKVGDLPLPPGKEMRKWGETPHFRPDERGQVLNNDFFGGNLRGVRSKLGYLRSLGVTTIYFNPIFEAYSNHRYDTGDYFKIDPLLGTVQDFDDLVKDAESCGIRIILDGVFNHTGADSRYFNKFGKYPTVGAFQSPQSPYADWYRFRSFPYSYESWWGISTLPAVNEASESYQRFLFGEDGVLKHWLRRGIGGYRLDVADELPDFFLKLLREAVKEESPEAVVIGEVWEDASNKIAYGERREYFQGAELDSVMNYPLKDAIINYVLTSNTQELRETIAMLIDNYPKDALDTLMNILGTHDTPRIRTVLGRKLCTDKEEMAVTRLTDGERTWTKSLMKIAAVLQFTLPGVPCVYYGDEIGMEGYLDPFCRSCFDWENGDAELTEFYRTLGSVRENELCAAFRDGVYREVFADASCLIFERKAEKQTAYVYVNCSANRYTFSFHGKLREHLTGRSYSSLMHVEAYSYGILSAENKRRQHKI